jgi:NRAMP (natural resistance-associated macrophage protein)-like metal ion transporter
VADRGIDLKAVIRRLGPGIVTGASDDDPSGIGTYAQVGAQFGYSILWTAPVTLPMMAAVQYICAKIGLVTGRGIAGVLRARFPTFVVVPAVLILIAANTINIGVDIGAIAAAAQLLVPVPAPLVIVPVTIALIVLLIAGSYELIARVFKWLTLALLAYVGASFLGKPDLGQVAIGTLVPSLSLDPKFLVAMVAIWGTTISPYLFFYQAEDEVEDQIKRGGRAKKQGKRTPKRELHLAGIDVVTGMFFSNLVMYFIFLATAATLHQSGVTHIASAADAAKALEPLAGPAAKLLLAAGLIGSGMLAVPILAASASYATAEMLSWRRGLHQPPQRAKGFYALIAIGMLLGMVINFVGIDPFTALFWTAVLNGIAAPPLLWLILIVANDRKVMGERTNGRWTNLLGGFTALLMTLLAVVWLVLLATGNG